MRRFGFSSGAQANGDFRTGVAMLKNKAIDALELSALRQCELRPMLDGIDDVDLSQFKYIAFHSPSQFKADDIEIELEQANHALPLVQPAFALGGDILDPR
jgi:hypothetical protein